MKVINLSIGVDDAEVKYSVDGTIGYIQEVVSKQKLKINKIPKDDKGLKLFRNNDIVETDIKATSYYYNEDARYFPTLHSLSFNPYLYEVQHTDKPETGAMFITINTNKYTMLKYIVTSLDIINTNLNKKTGIMSCTMRFVKGSNLVLFIKRKDNGEVIRLCIEPTLYDSIIGAYKINDNEYPDVNRKSVTRFGFRSYEVPRFVMCYEDEVGEILDFIFEKYHIYQSNLIPIEVERDIDLNDSISIQSIYGADLNRTKGLIISPDMHMPRNTSVALGLKYVFRLSKNKETNKLDNIRLVINN